MRYLLTAALLLAFCGTAWAKPFLYVENSDSGHITVIAIPEHEVVATFYAGPHPDDVAASPDGRTLYVNNQFYESADANAQGVNEVVAFDTVTAEVRWRTPVPGVPHHMSVSSDGNWLYVPLFDKNFTAVIDTREKRVVRRIFGVYGGHGTRLSADDRRLYVGSMVTDALYAVDVETGEPVKVVNFEDGVRPFTFTRDERTAYVQLSRLHGFDVVDLEAGRIVRRVELPELPNDAPVMNAFPHTWNHGVELSPDERYLLAAGSATEYVAVYTHPALELVKVIPTGAEPNWIVFTPDGRYAYVTARASDEISVIDMNRLEETARIRSTGDYPQRMRVVDVPADALAIQDG
ncbi:MAG TPA: beta-propeller fold lactonase family protein [Pseudomonadales bacterium]